MTRSLDIIALRSFTAIADNGGFHRAAESLELSQSTVSQHVRRLESTLDRPLVERNGRTSRFTPDGEILLGEARRILAAHDEALLRLSVNPTTRAIIVGATEHGSEQILPRIADALRTHYAESAVQFRIDKSSRLHERVDRASMDVAVFLGDAQHRRSRSGGELPLSWFSSADFEPPRPGRPWPLVVIDDPCTIRRRALATLSEHGIPNKVVAEAGYLAGVVNAVRGGIGVALLATFGPPPEGLVRRTDLPLVSPERLRVRVRAGADTELASVVATAVQSLLGEG